jgi:exonuclease VII large subunit
MFDLESMMEQSMAQYKAQMEETLAEALEQQKRMNDEMGLETTEENRRELIDAYAQQTAQYEAMMRQQMQLQAQMMGNIDPQTAQAMQEQMVAAMGAVQGDDDGDDEISEEELLAFVQANAVPAQYKKYMPIGALLIGTQGEPYETLRLMQDEEDTAYILENGWGIEDRDEALEMLESLLGGRHAKKFAGDFANARAGNFDALDEENAEDYRNSVEAIVEVLELPEERVNRCETLYAWDLERIGYLARLFVNIGYISEEEAWSWIQKAAEKIKATFTSWEDYMISVLLGRGFAMGLHREPYAVALDLLTDSRTFLDENPISAL